MKRFNWEMHYQMRIEDLEQRILHLRFEVDRLIRTRDAGSGSHEWDLANQRCFVCGMWLVSYQDKFLICPGSVRDVVDFQI